MNPPWWNNEDWNNHEVNDYWPSVAEASWWFNCCKGSVFRDAAGWAVFSGSYSLIVVNFCKFDRRENEQCLSNFEICLLRNTDNGTNRIRIKRRFQRWSYRQIWLFGFSAMKFGLQSRIWTGRSLSHLVFDRIDWTKVVQWGWLHA